MHDFIEHKFYPHFPDLKNVISIIIVGSVATQNYDKYSDIDIEIIFPSRNKSLEYLPTIQEYKKHLHGTKEPIQIHKPTTYQEIQSELETWQEDHLLREYSQALIINDPENRFLRIQQQFIYYPEEIYKEKISWLFAETVFQITERLETALARNDVYFSEFVKLQIVRLFLNTLLLLNKKWPAFDKHLYRDVQKLTLAQGTFVISDTLLTAPITAKSLPLIYQLKSEAEKRLLEAHLIKKESDQYWRNFRTKYQVKLTSS